MRCPQPLYGTCAVLEPQDGATACIGSAAPYLVTNRKNVVQPAAGSGAFQPFTSNVSRLLMSSFVGMQVGGEGVAG